MRFHSLFLFFLILISCHNNKISEQSIFDQNALSYIKVISENPRTDSLKINTSFFSKLPYQFYKQENILTSNISYITLPCDRPSPATVTINSQDYKVWVSPNDTSSITIKENLKSVSFSGKHSQISQYYLKKQNQLGFNDRPQAINQLVNKAGSHSKLITQIDSISDLELNFLKKANLDPVYEVYEMNDILYGALNFKLTFPFFNDVANIIKEPTPENYYDFLNEVEINSHEAITGSNYFSFLDYYFWRNIDKNILKQYNGKARVTFLRNHIYQQAGNELKPNIKKYYFAYNLSRMIEFYKNPEEIDSLVSSWQVEEYDYLFKNLWTELINKKVRINNGDKVPDFTFQDITGKPINLSDLNDKVIYINFWGTWCKPCLANIPDLNNMIDHYNESEDLIFLNICIKSKKEEWIKSVNNFNLKGLNVFIDYGDETSEFLSYLDVTGLPHYSILAKGNILKINYTNKAPLVKKDLNTLLIENK